MAEVIESTTPPRPWLGRIPGFEAMRLTSRLILCAEWWPVDKVILSYLGVTGLLVIFFFRRIPQAWGLLAFHIAGALLIWLAAAKPHGRASWIFHNWYPLAYVGICYREMSVLIRVIRGTDFDRELARLDFAIWGVFPTVWLERLQNPWITEFLQIVYSLFVPAFLLVAFVFWTRRRFGEFQYYAFLIALGFLTSYVGYFLVPIRGPRFLLANLHHAELQGLWSFHFLRNTLDFLESAHYDCFPSGHTEMSILAWWTSRHISPVLCGTFSVYTLCIIFATVYLRYHYTVDLLAGAALASVLLVATPDLYRRLRKSR